MSFKIPKKTPTSTSEKKAEFIAAFVGNFYDKLGMTKNAVVSSPLFHIITHMATMNMEKLATAEPAAPASATAGIQQAANSIVNSQDVALGIGAPFVLGGLGGAGLAKLFSPTQYEIKNLQKQELIAQYDNAIRELSRRIETRQ